MCNRGATGPGGGGESRASLSESVSCFTSVGLGPAVSDRRAEASCHLCNRQVTQTCDWAWRQRNRSLFCLKGHPGAHEKGTLFLSYGPASLATESPVSQTTPPKRPIGPPCSLSCRGSWSRPQQGLRLVLSSDSCSSLRARFSCPCPSALAGGRLS